ncbi:hypothetical protein EBQ90_05695 [bacterium]|nr:hypothetical protein [bacterium]
MNRYFLIWTSLFLLLLSPIPCRGAENCANVLANGGYLFATWAGLPSAPESELGAFWEKYMKVLCQQIECPIFCSEDGGKVPPELLALQKKCREKDTGACDAFFESLKITSKSPTAYCFYVGGKACDFCDRFGGDYCKPGMRFGGLKQDFEALLIHKIACKAGLVEACQMLNQRAEETRIENFKKCDELNDEGACGWVVNRFIDVGKIKEALEKALQVCRKSQYRVCTTLNPRGHKDMPSTQIEAFSKQFQEAMGPECRTSKNAEICSFYAGLIEKTQPQEALELNRSLCKQADPNNPNEIGFKACASVFRKSLEQKRWAEAQSLLKTVCAGLKEAQRRNGVSRTDCMYENDLKAARKKK